jgi:hypothetical protein
MGLITPHRPAQLGSLNEFIESTWENENALLVALSNRGARTCPGQGQGTLMVGGRVTDSGPGAPPTLGGNRLIRISRRRHPWGSGGAAPLPPRRRTLDPGPPGGCPQTRHKTPTLPAPPAPSAPPRASGRRRGWGGLAPAANESSGFLVRSPTWLAIGRLSGLGPPNLGDLNQSQGGERPTGSPGGGGRRGTGRARGGRR